jgi:hypothetical protein
VVAEAAVMLIMFMVVMAVQVGERVILCLRLVQLVVQELLTKVTLVEIQVLLVILKLVVLEAVVLERLEPIILVILAVMVVQV